MELKDKNKSTSDDEDDLEQLRLAALQSLKKPVVTNNVNLRTKLKKSPQNLNKRGRGFQGRNSRNGQFNNRSRNTNLISIPTVQAETSDIDSTTPPKKFKYGDNVVVSKLILPQDRYCNTKVAEEKSSEPISKFDRYDNSDKSESETENEPDSDSENESPPAAKLERTNSLEALMQELENEIQGDSKPKQEKDLKVKKKRKRKTEPDAVETPAPVDTINSVTVKTIETKDEEVESNLTLNHEIKSSQTDSHLQHNPNLSSRSPMHRNSPLCNRPQKHYQHDSTLHNMNFLQQNLYPLVFSHNIPFSNQPGPFNPTLPFNPHQLPPIEIQRNFIPNFPERSLSPLTLNTDDALTIARAPLSPRSAAFVLQNREIIERRKKSPRRSYSRSPSPRYSRRSKSPRSYDRSPSPMRKFLKISRSPTPTRQRSPVIEMKVSPVRAKSLEPPREKRLSPNREKYASPPRRFSPKRLSPNRRSPIRDRLSPYRRFPERKSPTLTKVPPNDRSPKPQNYRTPPKGSVRDRLGNKSHFNSKTTAVTPQSRTRKRSRSLSLSLSPERTPKDTAKEVKHVDSEKSLDPVLEARRRKFESNEIKNTEGIIRLKPKNEEKDTAEEEVVEQKENDVLIEDELDVLDMKVDDLFSDEETDEENEGRFKSHAHINKRNISVLPFTQLLADPAHNVKIETRLHDRSDNRKSRSVRDRRRHVTRERHSRSRNPSPAKIKEDKPVKIKPKIDEAADKKDKLYLKNKTLYRSDVKRDKVPVTAPIENKKIEIKIRNPSKYETTSKYDVANEHEIEKIEKVNRKVQAETKKEESDLDDTEPEIIIDNEDEADLTAKSEGDLRAQLSRKRAERQNKLPVAEDVQSRLLQNALQGAVFKKPKKSKKEKEPAPKDGKLPIHLRLGFANDLDAFTETVTHKKKKKSKSRGGLEQV